MEGAQTVCYPAIASYTVFLKDFGSPQAQESGLSGLDTVDRWAAGFLREGVFHCFASSARSRRSPSLAPSLEMPVYAGEPCVQITDTWGNRRFFLPARRV